MKFSFSLILWFLTIWSGLTSSILALGANPINPQDGRCIARDGNKLIQQNCLEQNKPALQFFVFEGNDESKVNEALEMINADPDVTGIDIIPKTENSLKDGVVAIPKAQGLSQVKDWIITNHSGIKYSYIFFRIVINGYATKIVLGKFYALTYLSADAIFAGALTVGVASGMFMVFSTQIDDWVIKGRTLFHQFARIGMFQLIFNLAAHSAFLGVQEKSDPAVRILTEDLLIKESYGVADSMIAGLGQTFWGFWNAYWNQRRISEIKSEGWTREQTNNELIYQEVKYKTVTALNSILNTSLALVVSSMASPEWAMVGYTVTAAGAALFAKEYISAKSMKNSGKYCGNLFTN